MRHTISVLVENEFGVLVRVAGLFSSRGYNIQSLTVAPTLDSTVSAMTIVTTGDDAHIEQITKQLKKLVNVIEVQEVTAGEAILRTLALIKVKTSEGSDFKIIECVKLLNGEILEVESNCLIAEFRGDEEKIQSAINLLEPYGIIEVVQTGNVAIKKEFQ